MPRCYIAQPKDSTCIDCNRHAVLEWKYKKLKNIPSIASDNQKITYWCLGVIDIWSLEFEIVCNSIFNKCHTIEACLRFSHFPQDQRWLQSPSISHLWLWSDNTTRLVSIGWWSFYPVKVRIFWEGHKILRNLHLTYRQK